jgi:hypothetical protein
MVQRGSGGPESNRGDLWEAQGTSRRVTATAKVKCAVVQTKDGRTADVPAHAISQEEKQAHARPKAVTCQNQNCEKRLLLRHLHASATRVRFNVRVLVDTDSSRVNAASGERAQRERSTETTRLAKFIGDDSKQKCNKGEHSDQSGSRNAAMRSGCAAHSS